MQAYRNTRYENEYLSLQVANGHHCERVAGSGVGFYSVCDCILFRDGKVYLVEVKATREKKFYKREKVKKQLAKMTAVAKNSNVGAILAIKFKYKGWVEEILV
jgi:Holliday junction resolvase